jgi:hypothetical protein
VLLVHGSADARFTGRARLGATVHAFDAEAWAAGEKADLARIAAAIVGAGRELRARRPEARVVLASLGWASVPALVALAAKDAPFAGYVAVEPVIDALAEQALGRSPGFLPRAAALRDHLLARDLRRDVRVPRVPMSLFVSTLAAPVTRSFAAIAADWGLVTFDRPACELGVEACADELLRLVSSTDPSSPRDPALGAGERDPLAPMLAEDVLPRPPFARREEALARCDPARADDDRPPPRDDELLRDVWEGRLATSGPSELVVARIFQAARRPTSTARRLLVACAIQVDGGSHWLLHPDRSFSASVGSRRLLGPIPSGARGWLFAREVDVAPGDAIRWRAVDHTVIATTDTGDREAPWPGRFPVVDHARGGGIECRAMDRAAALAFVGEDVGRLREALGRLDALHPDAEHGAPRAAEIELARAPLAGVADVLGWADPCTLGGIEAVTGFARRFAAEGRAQADARPAADRGEPVSLGGGLRARVLDAACTRPAFRRSDPTLVVDCRVEAAIENATGAPIALAAACEDRCATARLRLENGADALARADGLDRALVDSGGAILGDRAATSALWSLPSGKDLARTTLRPGHSARVSLFARTRARPELVDGNQVAEVVFPSGATVRLRRPSARRGGWE